MKLHRAITLGVMILVSLGLVAAMTAQGVAQWGSRSLAALLVVIVVAAIAGVAFSWRRYFPSGQRR
ncbi:MAG TPA: hypothetical protein VF134_00885 [Candidatus Dormibacteraeota bacterium]